MSCSQRAPGTAVQGQALVRDVLAAREREIRKLIDALTQWLCSDLRVDSALDLALLPLFEIVTAHTPNLAEAYSVESDDLDDQDSDEGVVVHLRRHLEAQRQILANVA